MSRIGIDMDEVIADFQRKDLAVYNQIFGKKITLADMRGTTLAAIDPASHERMVAERNKPGYFRDFAVIKDAPKVVQALQKEHEVFIVSAAMDFPNCLLDKYDWLAEHFPFIPASNIVLCGDKSVIATDYLIDDHASHFEKFTGQGILFSSPHNLNEAYPVRVNNWQEVAAYFHVTDK